MQVNAPEYEKFDQENWVFPNFISPNQDGKNDIWVATYKGYDRSENFNSPGVFTKEKYYFNLGCDGIKSIKIVNFFNPKIIYVESESDRVPQSTVWDPTNHEIKSFTLCLLTVDFKNGTTKNVFIGVNPASKDK
jgi:hypothetical protein